MRRVVHPELSLGLAVVASALTVGLVVPAASIDLRFVPLVVLVGTLLLPLIYRSSRGAFDLFEPLTVFCLLTLFMLAGRFAVALYEPGDVYWRGFFIEAGLGYAIWVSAIGACSWVAGYELAARTRGKPTQVRADVSDRHLMVGVIATAAGGIGAFSLFLIQSGLGFEWFTSGRQTYDTAYRASVGYLYDAPLLVVPTALLAAETVRRGFRLVPILSGLAWLPFLVGTFFHGHRLTLLALTASLVTFMYLRAARRPGTVAVLIVAACILVPFAALREARVGDDSVGTAQAFREALANPGDSAKSVTLGTDLEAADGFTYLLQYLGERSEFHPGTAVWSTLAAPIPRALWPEKPIIPEEQIAAEVFPGDYARSRAGATYTMFGSMYYDSGIIGVIIGMASVGALFAMFWRRFGVRRDTLSCAIAALVPVLMFIFVRASLFPLAQYALFLAAPLVLLVWLQHRAALAPAR